MILTGPIRIEAVDAALVRPLRGRVLRPGQPPEQLRFAGDDDAEAVHLAASVGGRIVAIASVMPEAHPREPRPGDWRVRGMATDPRARGRGIGRELLERCAGHAAAKGGDRLWCNARVGARRFYERAGFAVEGAPFELAGIGRHYLMSRRLHGH